MRRAGHPGRSSLTQRHFPVCAMPRWRGRTPPCPDSFLPWATTRPLSGRAAAKVAEAKLAERERRWGAQAEVAALSETVRLTKTSKDHRVIKAAEKKNAKLKTKQYQSSLSTLSAQLKRHARNLNLKRLSPTSERKFKAELNARGERIAKLQKQ